MATEETNIQQLTRMIASKNESRVFRNNRGFFITMDAIGRIKDACLNGGIGQVLATLKTLRKIRAGLEVDGSADLIGWQSVIVTQAMVGSKVAIFVGAEIKTPMGVASDGQKLFIKNVRDAGGIAGIVRNDEDATKLFSKYKV